MFVYVQVCVDVDIDNMFLFQISNLLTLFKKKQTYVNISTEHFCG